MTIIGNGTLLTNTPDNPVVPTGAILVRDGKIAALGDTASLLRDFPGRKFVDARGGIIMPGIVNAHHHFYSALARGMQTKNPKISKNFNQILENLWWRLDRALTPGDVRLSAALSLADSLRAGVTTVIDHHASYGAIAGSLEEIAGAVQESGLRACLCYEVSDRLGPDAAREGIEENRRFIDSVRHCDGRLAGLFGLHASFTLSDATLAACREAAGDAGFHVHVAEGMSDVEDSLAKYGKRVVERLHGAGILGPRTLAAHCIHVSPAEIELLAASKTTVLHNPQSNMSNAVGTSPLLQFLKRGVRVCLGTDGYTHDLFESAKAAGLLQRQHLGDPSVAWGEPYELLLRANPVVAGGLFSRRLGVLEAGAEADVIIVDYRPPTPLLAENIAGHMHFGFYGPMVRDAMIGGRWAMRDRELILVNEQSLRARCREAAAKLWERL